MPRASGATSSRSERLCAPVPRDDAEARRRPYRRPLARPSRSSRRPPVRNPRSTVATVTEIYDYMRLLWARVGVPYSPATGLPIERPDVSQMVDRVDGAARRHAATTCSPRSCAAARASIARSWPSGRRPASPASASTASFTRSRTPPRSTRISSTTSRWWSTASSSAKASKPRLADSFETALKLADGLAYLDPADAPPERPAAAERTGVAAALEDGARARGPRSPRPDGRITFSEKFACPVSGFTIAEIEPRLFSFNAPQGACPACDGLGEKLLFDEAGRPQRGAVDQEGRGRPLGRPTRPALITCRCCPASPALTISTSTRRGPTCPRRRTRHPPRHRRPPVTLRFIDGSTATRSRSRSTA